MWGRAVASSVEQIGWGSLKDGVRLGKGLGVLTKGLAQERSSQKRKKEEGKKKETESPPAMA